MYWRGVRSALAQRGMLKKRKDDSYIPPCAQAVVLPDRVVFLLDMNRLAGISREQWLNEDLWLQIRATLQGRRTFVADSAGLALVIAREPGTRVKRLPRTIPMRQEVIPNAPWRVVLGRDRHGTVDLDLAQRHRAVLLGGATGSGKTNALQTILAQLVAKHTPDEVQLAVVDTKEVDFSGAWEQLPHLMQPIAHDMGEAATLIEKVEAERIRRQAAMVQAGVNDWQDLEEPLPLLVLAVDEAADLHDTVAMDTLVQVARKGRAFGVSVLLGTQYPTSRVIDPQVKANLPTAIAFQCRTRTESRVILDRSGAEDLDRPGLALTFISGRWHRVQVLKADPALVEDAARTTVSKDALSDTERTLVRYALQELDGAFTVGKLYNAHPDVISKHRLAKLARRWEQRGWLTEPEHAAAPRRVTPALAAMARNGRDTDRDTA
jgi:DNA segregation ATPase FtsK/SpoIIIE-like protein